MSDRIMNRPLSAAADAEWDRIFGKRERPEYVPPDVEQQRLLEAERDEDEWWAEAVIEPSTTKPKPCRSASKMVVVPRRIE